MEESTSTQKKLKFRPKTGVLPQDVLTAQKKPRNTTAIKLKPRTMAEIKAEIQALNIQIPRSSQLATTSKKKGSNSSIKVDTKISDTGNGKSHINGNVTNTGMTTMPSVSNSRVTTAAAVPPRRKTHLSSEKPKFPKPENRGKKSHYTQGRTNVRITGTSNIPETPAETKSAKPRVTIANKENNPNTANMNRKSGNPKLIITPDTSISNGSSKFGSGTSFIQTEKEIQETEQITNAILDARHTLENIAEVSSPVATPFVDYRQDTEHSNNSSVMHDSHRRNDPIMCFHNPHGNEKVSTREESVIVSLCNMLNKASVGKTEHQPSKLDELLEVERQSEHNIKMIDNAILMLANIKDSQQKILNLVRKTKKEKSNSQKSSDNDLNATLTNLHTEDPKSPEKSPIIGQPYSVITKSMRSSTYKIPKKAPCLRKRVFRKSLPNVATNMSTPIKLDGGELLSMYLEMKKLRPAALPDAPAGTSQDHKCS